MNRTRLALRCLPAEAFLDAAGRVRSNIPSGRRRRHAKNLHRKRLLKKTVVVTRLVKAAFTFQGAVNYARWKVARHTDLQIKVSDFQKQHPVLGGLLLYIRASLRGAFR